MDLMIWIGNLYDVLPRPVASAVLTLAAVLCGAAVGVERGKRQKPAGLRTMMLICLGACVFTQGGEMLTQHTGDASRVASQVVTGIGFLGAGAILRGRGTITGVTTAAAIWVTAAIGVVLGSGYVVAGAFFTTVAVATLAFEENIEAIFFGRCEWADARIVFDPLEGRARWLIQEALDENQIDDMRVTFAPPAGATQEATLRYCRRHRQHRAVLSQLASLPAVQRIEYTNGP